MWTPCQQGQCWCWARPCAKLLEEGLAQRSGWTPTVDLMSTSALTAKWALFWASEQQTQLKEIIPLNNCPYQVTNLCFLVGSHHLLSKRLKKKKKSEVLSSHKLSRFCGSLPSLFFWRPLSACQPPALLSNPTPRMFFSSAWTSRSLHIFRWHLLCRFAFTYIFS